jgi:hypothetical protein
MGNRQSAVANAYNRFTAHAFKDEEARQSGRL